MTEIIGYIATVVTIFSFTQSTVFRIRLINGTAAMLWVVYGFMAASYPNVVTNGIILMIHTFWFIKNRNSLQKT